jgi:hypothetical protein
MAKNYRDYSYFENRPDVVRIFDELDAYLDWCRLELQPFNPADLYKRDSTTYQNYLSKSSLDQIKFTDFKNHNMQLRERTLLLMRSFYTK